MMLITKRFVVAVKRVLIELGIYKETPEPEPNIPDDPEPDIPDDPEDN